MALLVAVEGSCARAPTTNSTAVIYEMGPESEQQGGHRGSAVIHALPAYSVPVKTPKVQADGGGKAGGGGGRPAAALPSAPASAPTAVQRCPKCKAKVQQCMCNVRRNSVDMARVQQQAKCVQATSQGPCQQLASGKSPRCADHTCQHSKCHGAKSSQAKHCKKHAKQEGGARLDAPAADTEA